MMHAMLGESRASRVQFSNKRSPTAESLEVRPPASQADSASSILVTRSAGRLTDRMQPSRLRRRFEKISFNPR